MQFVLKQIFFICCRENEADSEWKATKVTVQQEDIELKGQKKKKTLTSDWVTAGLADTRSSVAFSGFFADMSSGQSRSVNVTAVSADLCFPLPPSEQRNRPEDRPASHSCFQALARSGPRCPILSLQSHLARLSSLSSNAAACFKIKSRTS